MRSSGVGRTRRKGGRVSAQGNRRIDRISRPEFVEGLSDLSLDELRSRRDDCLAEREYLSLLRRLVQGRAEILQAELERRGGDDRGPLVDRLSEILAADQQGPSRGEAVRVSVPEEEMLLARRRVERLVANAGLSDPGALDDDQLNEAAELLTREEREVSSARATVLGALDALQDELKRRYKDDPSLVLA
jgi:chromosome segregation ATPase